MLEKMGKYLFEVSLLEKHQSSVIPLAEIGETYFNNTEKTIKAKFLSGELKDSGLHAFSCADSQKSPVFVHVSDLANFLLKKREVVIGN